MSLTDIASKVSLFKPSETIIMDYSNVNINKSLHADINISKDMNTIFLLSGLIIGDININMTSVTHELNTISESEENLRSIGASITKVAAMIQAQSNEVSVPSSGDLILYYPLLTGSSLDPRLTISSTETLTHITTSNFNNLAIPGGKSMILVFAKTSSPQNVHVNIVRPSYTSQICEPCTTCTDTVCPLCTVCEECKNTNAGDTETLLCGIILVLLIFLFVLIVMMCFLLPSRESTFLADL